MNKIIAGPAPRVDPFGFLVHADDLTAWQDHLDAAERDARAAMAEAASDRAREEAERQGGGWEDETGCDGFPW
jgi:hypothetical protein